MFMTYFQQLFSSSNPEIEVSDLNSIPRVVTAEMNESLIENFQPWEVELANGTT